MDEGITNAFSKYKRGITCLILRGGLTVILGLSAVTDPNWTLDLLSGHHDMFETGESPTFPPFEDETSRAAKLARKCTMIAGVYTCVWGFMMVMAAAQGTCDMMRGMTACSAVHGLSCIAIGAIEGKSTLFVVAIPFITLDMLAFTFSKPKMVRVSSTKTLYYHGGAQGLSGMDAPGTTITRVNSRCELRERKPSKSKGKLTKSGSNTDSKDDLTKYATLH